MIDKTFAGLSSMVSPWFNIGMFLTAHSRFRQLAGLFALLFALAVPAAAQEGPVVEIGPGPTQRLDLGPYVCAFADQGRALELEEVLRAAPCMPVPGGLIDFGFGDARYWVQVRLLNKADVARRWWVTHDIPSADEVEVFLVHGPDGKAEKLLNQKGTDSFGAREIPHRHLVSEVALSPRESATLVIAYTTGQATEMPLFIESNPAFFKRVQGETAQILSLTALILGMGLISTLYLYGIEGRRALVYGSYVLSSAILLIHMEGFAFQYLWPTAPTFNQIALAFLSMGSIVLGLIFVAIFTNTPDQAPRLYRVTLATIAGLGVLCVLSVPMISTIWYKNITLVAVGSGTVLQVVLAAMAARRGVSGAFALTLGFSALASTILFGVFGYLTQGLFEQELVGGALRLGFLIEALAFSAAIALRIRTARQERDASLRAQLRLSQERLELSEALRRAEDDRQRAAMAARRSQEALASAAHDMRQPLASLQMALSADTTDKSRIESSLAYLEEIVRKGLEDPDVPLGTGEADPPDRGAAEEFQVDVVLNSIAAMFEADAASRGIALKVQPSTVRVLADPLTIMRSLGNLVSNALNHADPRRVLVGCRRDGDKVRFEVHDDGKGMSSDELTAHLRRGQKSEASKGNGLGLAILSELSDGQDLCFDIRSWPGRGTIGRLATPIAPRRRRPLAHRRAGGTA